MRGSISFAGPDSLTLDRIESLLSAQYKSERERGADFVTFNDPLWEITLVPNWLAMVLYDRGRFSIDHTVTGPTLHYELRSLHAFVFCLVAGLTFFGFGMLGGSLLNALKMGAFAFSWLYGFNIVLAYFRVPSAIRRAVKDSAIRRTGPGG